MFLPFGSRAVYVRPLALRPRVAPGVPLSCSEPLLLIANIMPSSWSAGTFQIRYNRPAKYNYDKHLHDHYLCAGSIE